MPNVRSVAQTNSTIHIPNNQDDDKKLAFNISDVLNNIQKALTPLNEKIVAVAKKIKDYLTYFSSLNESELKTGLSLSNEYMAEGKYGTGSPGQTIETLRVETKNSPVPEIQNFDKLLAYAQIVNAYTDQFSSVFHLEENLTGLSKLIKKDIKNLKEGETLLIPCGYQIPNKGHTVLITLTRQEGKLLLQIHNEGAGLQYHHQEILKNSVTMFQTVYEIEIDNEGKLTADDSPVLYDIFKLLIPDPENSIGKLYGIVSSLGKKLPKRKVTDWDTRSIDNPNRDYWSRGQLGKTCYARAFVSVARTVLPPQQYWELKSALKTNYLFRLYADITHSRETEFKKMASIEILSKLLKSYDKHGVVVPEKLKILQTELAAFESEKSEELHTPYSLDESLDYLEIAINNKNYWAAHKYLEEAFRFAQNRNNISKNNLDKLLDLSQKVREIYKNRGLSSNKKDVQDLSRKTIDLFAGIHFLTLYSLERINITTEPLEPEWLKNQSVQLHHDAKRLFRTYIQLKLFKSEPSPWATHSARVFTQRHGNNSASVISS